jgi:hypothetical protein
MKGGFGSFGMNVSLINPLSDDLDLSRRKWVATHWHSGAIRQAKNALDQQTFTALAGQNRRTRYTAAQNCSLRIKPQLAHHHIAHVALAAGLLKNGRYIFFELNLRAAALGRTLIRR